MQAPEAVRAVNFPGAEHLLCAPSPAACSEHAGSPAASSGCGQGPASVRASPSDLHTQSHANLQPQKGSRSDDRLTGLFWFCNKAERRKPQIFQ